MEQKMTLKGKILGKQLNGKSNNTGGSDESE
jgi:hypothetical protein